MEANMKLRAIGLVGTLSILAITAMGYRNSVDSGLKIGEMVSAFDPHHITGPLKGTNSCPPCTYGNRPAVQVWVNGDDSANIEAMAKLLDKEAAAMKNAELKTFMIVVTEAPEQTAGLLTKIATENKLANVHLATLSPKNEAVTNYKFNLSPEVKNTVFVYKDRKVEAKFVNISQKDEGFKPLEQAIVKIAN
jgi:hypothetical protein